MRRDTAPAVLQCLGAAALFAASTPASKRLLAGVGPQTLAGLLYLGAAAAVAPFALRRLGGLRHPGAANVRRLAGSAVLGGGVAPVLLLLGLSRAPSASVALWLTLEGAMTAALAAAFFRESVGRLAWAAVALAAIANALLVGPAESGGLAAASLVAGACLCWALDNNLTAKIDGVTPAQTTLVKGLVAGAANLALGFAFEDAPPAPAVATALAVGGVAYGASLVLYIASSQRLGAARSQLLFSTSPFLGMVLSWTALGEPVRTIQVVCAALLAVAVALAVLDRHEHEHAHEPMRHTHAHRHDDGHHDHDHAPGQPAAAWHTHEHEHRRVVHSHPHHPDLHHRHTHGQSRSGT